MNADNYYFGEIRIVNGTDFGVIGLNSAWASHGGRDDSNNIYIYIGNAIKRCDRKSKAVVDQDRLITPPSIMYEEDNADIQNLLYQHCHIILHGHLHRPDFQIVNSIRGEQIIIPAGAIFQGRRISNSYNITTLDSKRGTIRILPRRFYDGPRKFLKDIESLGNDEPGYFEAKIPDRILRNLK